MLVKAEKSSNHRRFIRRLSISAALICAIIALYRSLSDRGQLSTLRNDLDALLGDVANGRVEEVTYLKRRMQDTENERKVLENETINCAETEAERLITLKNQLKTTKQELEYLKDFHEIQEKNLEVALEHANLCMAATRQEQVNVKQLVDFVASKANGMIKSAMTNIKKLECCFQNSIPCFRFCMSCDNPAWCHCLRKGKKDF